MEFNITQALTPYHQASGAAFSTFTTKKDVSPLPLPVARAGTIRAGTKILLRANGEYSCATGVVLTLGFWFGTATSTITGDVALASAFTTGTSPTAWPWRLEWEGICNLPGSAGTLLGQGAVQIGSALTTFNAETPIPVTAALRTVSSFDTTIDRAFGVSATWGASAAGNTVTVYDLTALVLN